MSNADRLETFRIAYLGKKGRVTALLKGMGKLPPEERPEAGKIANRVKARLGEAFEAYVTPLWTPYVDPAPARLTSARGTINFQQNFMNLS